MKVNQVKKLAIGSAVVVGTALASVGLAQADGYARRERVVYEQPWNWSGFYFGVHSGYAWSDIDGTWLAPGSGNFSVTHDAPIVGGHIGIQHQFGQLVVGVEGSYDFTFRNSPGVSRCTDTNLATGALSTWDCVGRLNDIISVGPRIGWA